MLSFSGFVVSFMMRMDINLAMVQMVKFQQTNANENKTFTPVCNIPSNFSTALLEDTSIEEDKVL